MRSFEKKSIRTIGLKSGVTERIAAFLSSDIFQAKRETPVVKDSMKSLTKNKHKI